MKRWQRRALFSLLAVLIAAPLLFAVATYAGAWYYRIQAEKLLACVRSLQLGVTSEAEFLKVIQPLQLKVSDHREVVKDNPSKITYEYRFYNVPNWALALFDQIPECVKPVVSRLMLNWTMFSASLEFEGGKLTKLHVFAFQGEGHPFSGSVTIYAGRASILEVLWRSRKSIGDISFSPQTFLRMVRDTLYRTRCHFIAMFGSMNGRPPNNDAELWSFISNASRR